MRNSDAHLLVPPTLVVVDRSDGATARCGGAKHGKDNSTKELRSDHSSGCPSYWELQGTYLDDAESRRRAVQLRRRRSAAATMATTRRRRPGHPEGDRVIKMEPMRPTGAARERNRGEVHSPAEETKNSARGRKRGKCNSAPPCR